MKQNQIGLIGKSLKHSYSKQIHESFEDHPYELIELTEDELELFLSQPQFKGINITIPYKQAVLPHLDFIDPACRSIGACNCIVNHNGLLFGYNTDILGIEETFRLHNISPAGKKILILGNGGATKAFAAYARANKAADIQIVYYKPAENTISYQEAYEKHHDADIVLNATPVGMFPRIEGSPIDLSRFDHLEFVFDAVYNPSQTSLLQQAQALGIPYANGLPMLVEQARKANELFFSRPLNPERSKEIMIDILQQSLNIVLIGMPSSGKSLLATLLSQRTKKKLIDMDAWIEKRENRKIAQIFEQEGEEAFRFLESKLAQHLSLHQKSIISTGGGVILNPANMEALSKNGLIVYVDRPLELLVHEDPERPTLKQGIANLYEKRAPLYHKYADLVVYNDGSLKDVIHSLEKGLKKPSTYKRFLGGIK